MKNSGLKFYFLLSLLTLVSGCAELFGEDEKKEDESKLNTSPLRPGMGKLAIGDDSTLDTIPGVVESVTSLGTEESQETQEFNSPAGSLSIEPFGLVATTGISLGNDTKLEDFSGKSYAACEMVNRARGFLDFAAKADLRVSIKPKPKKRFPKDMRFCGSFGNYQFRLHNGSKAEGKRKVNGSSWLSSERRPVEGTEAKL